MGNARQQNLTAQQISALTQPQVQALKPLNRTDSTISSDGWSSRIIKTAGDLSQDHALQTALRAHKAITTGLDALDQVRTNRSPYDTEAVHLQRVDEASTKFRERVFKQVEQAKGSIGQRQKELKYDMKERLGIDTTSSYAQEVRNVLRGMTPQERLSAIDKAIKEKDSLTLSAIWEAPALTFGMEVDKVEKFKDRALAIHALDLLNLSKSLNDSIELLGTAQADIYTVTLAGINSDKQKEILAKAEQSMKAQSALDEIMGG